MTPDSGAAAAVRERTRALRTRTPLTATLRCFRGNKLSFEGLTFFAKIEVIPEVYRSL